MVENRLPEKRDIATEGGNYNEHIEGDHIQGNKGDTIDQSGSFGVGDNDGNISAQNVAGTFSEKVSRNHNQAQTIVNIENNYANVPDVPSGSNAPQAPVNKELEASSQAEAMFVLTGKLCAGDKVQLKAQKEEIKAIVAHLKKRYDLDLTILDVTEGSVKIKLGGSQEDLERLSELFKSGELTEVLGIPVEDVRLLLGQSEETKGEKKSRLIEEIKTQGAEGRDLSDANLNRANLNRANLNRANLNRANLIDANLRNANLSDANLSDANLIGANLIRADLSNANLSGADLSFANLIDANLIGADLRGANLAFANLIGAKIDSATKISDKWRLVREIVNQGAQGRNLNRANLNRANLIGANLSGANLSNADLRGANLIDANLSDANLIGANLIDANLRGANLTFANLIDANLIGADLRGANLAFANLIGAKIDSATKISDKWRLVHEIVNQGAQGRNLNRANLIDANLRGADLSGADLSGADLSDANLIDANLSGANLSGASVENARFGDNPGISESEKHDLINRGAIFADSPGDRSRVLV